jgi:hypothetical protein
MLGSSAAVYGGKCHRYCRALLVLSTLLDTAGIDPEVVQAIASGLFAAEFDFATASLTSAIVCFQIEKGDFFRSPRMRQYSIGWDLVLSELLPGQVAMFVQRQ